MEPSCIMALQHATHLFSQHSMKLQQDRPPPQPRTQSPQPPYLHTYPHCVLRHYASNMILKVMSDVAYFIQPKARNCAATHYHIGWLNIDRANGPIEILCKTIKNIASLAAAAESGGIYMGGKHARCPMRAALEELSNSQPLTGSPFETDNSTAQGVLTSKMRQKLSKSSDMRYWWMKDRINNANSISSGPQASST